MTCAASTEQIRRALTGRGDASAWLGSVLPAAELRALTDAIYQAAAGKLTDGRYANVRVDRAGASLRVTLPSIYGHLPAAAQAAEIDNQHADKHNLPRRSYTLSCCDGQVTLRDGTILLDRRERPW